MVEGKPEAEPDFQYIPAKSPSEPSELDQDAWRDSMQQLKEGLSSGDLLTHFDVSALGIKLSCTLIGFLFELSSRLGFIC